MKKPKEPHLLTEAKPRKRQSTTVLRVSLFTRPGSRYYQARIKIGKLLKRITTGRTLRAAAEEYAELAYHHYTRLSRERGHAEALMTTPPDPSQPDLPFK